MRKRQKRLIVIGALSLISLMSLFLMVIGLNHINQSYEMRLPDYVLVQGKSNQLYLAHTKKQQVKPQCHLVKCHWDFQRHREINFNFTMPFFRSVKH